MPQTYDKFKSDLDSSIKDRIETRMLSPNPTKATENRFSEFDDDK